MGQYSIKVTICCESGRLRSKYFAREISKEFRSRGIEAKVTAVGIRNTDKNPFSPLKFLAYMFMKPLTKSIADNSDHIIVMESWMYKRVTNDLAQPKEKVVCYDTNDCEIPFLFLPLLNQSQKDQIRVHINNYFSTFFPIRSSTC